MRFAAVREANMLQAQLVAAIAAARTTTVLDALAKAVWSGMAGGHLSEEAAREGR